MKVHWRYFKDFAFCGLEFYPSEIERGRLVNTRKGVTCITCKKIGKAHAAS